MTTERRHTDMLIGGLFILVTVSTLIFALSIPDRAVVPVAELESRIAEKLRALADRIEALEKRPAPTYEDVIRPALAIGSPRALPPEYVGRSRR